MSIKNCDHCGKLIDLDTDVEHEEVCKESKPNKGIDWSKKDMYEGIGREDLKPSAKRKPQRLTVHKKLDMILEELALLQIKP